MIGSPHVCTNFFMKLLKYFVIFVLIFKTKKKSLLGPYYLSFFQLPKTKKFEKKKIGEKIGKNMWWSDHIIIVHWMNSDFKKWMNRFRFILSPLFFVWRVTYLWRQLKILCKNEWILFLYRFFRPTALSCKHWCFLRMPNVRKFFNLA